MSQTWTIRSARYKELNDSMGHCDAMSNTILLDPDLPKDVMLATLAHELVHLIEITMNLHLTEQQVDCLGIGIIHLLKENPEILNLYTTEVLEVN